jgi:hypothetical protein
MQAKSIVCRFQILAVPAVTGNTAASVVVYGGEPSSKPVLAKVAIVESP